MEQFVGVVTDIYTIEDRTYFEVSSLSTWFTQGRQIQLLARGEMIENVRKHMHFIRPSPFQLGKPMQLVFTYDNETGEITDVNVYLP